jgi:hypothetical protein
MVESKHLGAKSAAVSLRQRRMLLHLFFGNLTASGLSGDLRLSCWVADVMFPMMVVNHLLSLRHALFDGWMRVLCVRVSRRAYFATPRPAQAALHYEHGDSVPDGIAVKLFDVD